MNKRSSGGFSMIEVLVSLVVFALGFLALSLLQNKALKNNQSAYITSQATIFAQSMMDKIRANPDGDYVLTAGTTLSKPGDLCRSTTSSCTARQMAAVDKYEWQQNLFNRMAGAEGIIDRQALKSGGSPVDNMLLYRVTINWTEQGGAQWGVEQKDQQKSITLESL